MEAPRPEGQCPGQGSGASAASADMEVEVPVAAAAATAAAPAMAEVEVAPPQDIGDAIAAATATADAAAAEPAAADLPEQGDAKAAEASTASPAAMASDAAAAPTAGGANGSAPNPPPPEAEVKKALGNAAFEALRYSEALEHYGAAIALAGEAAPGVYFSNRAVCRAALEQWPEVREDAAEALRRFALLATSSRPANATKKAFFQKARAECRLQLHAEAEETLQLAASFGLRAEVDALLRKEDGRASARPAAAAAGSAAGSAASRGAGGSSTPATSSTAAPPAAAASTAAATAAEGADPAAKAKQAGNAKYKEGAYREALTEYRRALELLPQDDVERRAPLLGNIAAACLMLKQADECISACEQSLALDPASSKIRGRLATAQVAKCDFAVARAALVGGDSADAAVANASKLIGDVERQLTVADTAFTGGEPGKALSMYQDMESKALFCSPAVTLKIARCYLELRSYPNVLRATQQVLSKNKQNVDALVLRTEALFRNNDAAIDTAQWAKPLEQGKQLLGEALRLHPDHSVARALHRRFKDLITKQGELRTAFGSREFEKSQEVIDCMVTQAQDNQALLAALYEMRAKCAMRLKDWPRVLKDVGNALYRNHTLVQPYLLRAQAFQALDRLEDAVKELEGLFNWHRVQDVYDKLQEAKFLLRKKMRTNYYELLQVPSVASALEIKKAYIELAREWHPDKKGHLDEVGKKNAEEMFKRIGEAYEVLTDPHKKEYYDKGYDKEGIEEQIEIKKRRTEGHGHGHGHGHCC